MTKPIDLEPSGLEVAKRLRSKLCIDSECTFDRGCGCLNAITEALSACSAPDAGKAVDANLALARKIAAGRAFNRPGDKPGERLVGFYVPEEVAGLSDALFALDAIRAALASPAPSGAEPVDGPEEIEIDRLRLAAFKTNTNEDKAAYYLAVSKWFQDRHYRRLASPQAVAPAEETAEQPLSRMSADDGRPMWEQISDLIKFHMNERPPIRLRDELVTILDWARYGEARLTASEAEASDLRRKLEEGIEPYFARQIEWSKETFGPALRTHGVIDHIRKELTEIEANPHDLSEWIDVVILAMDGFWRHGGAAADLMPRLLAKQQKNMARSWPDWRTMSEDQAIEHDRSEECALTTDGGPNG